MSEEFSGEERRKINGDLAKLTAEAGAKLAALEDARTEMKSVRESVLVLAEAIGHTASTEELDAAGRRTRIHMAFSLFLAATVLIVLGAFLLHGQALGRQGTRCVALQLFEHQATNQASHDEVFNRFNIPIPPHRTLAPEPTEANIAAACAPFLKGYP